MARCQYNFNSGILANCKTRMAPKQNYHCMITDMKCQINNLKSHASPTHPYLQLPSFTFFAPDDLYSGPFWNIEPASWWLSQSCESWQLPLAAEMWAQMGQITNTARQNTCGTLPGQLHWWHPCEWQDKDG